jgi:DNA-binding MarR family transcriptional regulator
VTKKQLTTGTGKRAANAEHRQASLNSDVLETLIGFHIRRAMMELRRNYYRHAVDDKIRPGLSSLLQLVASNHGASQVQLSKALHIDKATLVALIDSAESVGWLKRQRSNTDRRCHEVILTPKGEEVVARLTVQTMRNEKKFRSRFTEQELTQLVEYLQRIYRK